MSYSFIPNLMWSEAERITIYNLNKVSSKLVPSNLFELWIDRKSNLKYLHI